MTAVGISVVICVIVYLVIAFQLMVKSHNADGKETIIRITAPPKEEIEKEQKKASALPVYPDSLFERLCCFILQDDPNPRKVVKLMQKGFSESEKELLLQCLSINNPTLHREVLSLQFCDSSHYEDYEEKEIQTKTEEASLENGESTKEEQTGIPADFFITAMELNPNPDTNIINHISFVYEHLSPDEEEIIRKQCERIISKKKQEKITEKEDCAINDILVKATEETELFMQLFKEKLQEE